MFRLVHFIEWLFPEPREKIGHPFVFQGECLNGFADVTNQTTFNVSLNSNISVELRRLDFIEGFQGSRFTVQIVKLVSNCF